MQLVDGRSCSGVSAVLKCPKEMARVRSKTAVREAISGFSTIARTTAILLACAMVVIFLAFGGRYLVVNQTPVKSDVIIVLVGGSRDRVQRAVELFRQGYAPAFIMSGGAMYNATLLRLCWPPARLGEVYKIGGHRSTIVSIMSGSIGWICSQC